MKRKLPRFTAVVSMATAVLAVAACTPSTTPTKPIASPGVDRLRHDHVLALLHRPRGGRDPGRRQRLRGEPPEHQGGRQVRPGRRQDDPGHRRRSGPRRRSVLLHRHRRQVLQVRRLAGPVPVHRARQDRHEQHPGAGAQLHRVRRQAVHDAVPERRLRHLLQQGHVRREGHHRPAEDARRADRGREEAHRSSTRTAPSRWPASTRCSASTRTRPRTSPRWPAPSG